MDPAFRKGSIKKKHKKAQKDKSYIKKLLYGESIDASASWSCCRGAEDVVNPLIFLQLGVVASSTVSGVLWLS